MIKSNTIKLYLLIQPYEQKILYQEIIHHDTGSRRNLCGIQIIGAILAHGINIYYDGKEVDLNGLTEIEFYNALIKNISNKNRDVYTSAAEVWHIYIKNKRKKVKRKA